jgi:hypothetical protein
MVLSHIVMDYIKVSKVMVLSNIVMDYIKVSKVMVLSHIVMASIKGNKGNKYDPAGEGRGRGGHHEHRARPY